MRRHVYIFSVWQSGLPVDDRKKKKWEEDSKKVDEPSGRRATRCGSLKTEYTRSLRGGHGEPAHARERLPHLQLARRAEQRVVQAPGDGGSREKKRFSGRETPRRRR